jgi:AcrR family transcriptional regulator
MSSPEITARARPMRADARRNYDKVIAAAREAFAERGASTSLEEIARRAGVGIGTLYRHFPTRQALLEAVYVEEVEALAESVSEYEALPPWEALTGWLRRLAAYLATKRALAEELMNYVDSTDPLFKECKMALYSAGEPLLTRAQEAGVIRSDTDLSDIIHMVGGIAKITTTDPAQIEHILGIAIDGLRYRPA